MPPVLHVAPGSGYPLDMHLVSLVKVGGGVTVTFVKQVRPRALDVDSSKHRAGFHDAHFNPSVIVVRPCGQEKGVDPGRGRRENTRMLIVPATDVGDDGVELDRSASCDGQ